MVSILIGVMMCAMLNDKYMVETLKISIMLVSRVAPALDPAWQGWQSKKTALLWTHLLYRLQNSYNYEISDSHISGRVKIASLICQIKMKAKSHRSSTQSRSMFQQQSKPTDCSFWAPCSRVCIPSSWQLFVWVKKKNWSWGEAALVLRPLYGAGSSMPWWVRSLSEGSV